MTTMDVVFTFRGALSLDQIKALSQLSDVYGIRALKIDENAAEIAVEYDATRMTQPNVEGLLRRCKVDLAERINRLATA